MSRRRDSRHRSRSRSRSPRRRISPHRSAVVRHRDLGDKDRQLDGRDSMRGWRDRRGRSAENVREHRQRDRSREGPVRDRNGERPGKDRSRERPGRDRSRERLGRNRSRERPIGDRSRERPLHRDDRQNHRDNADLRTFISGRVTYDDPASRLGSSQNNLGVSQHREGSRFSRYDRDQDWSRGRTMRGGEDRRERTRSTGSLNLNPTDVPRSDRYFEHDSRGDEQGGGGRESDRRRRRSSLREDGAPDNTPAKWGHDMFDRYYGEGQSPSATDDEQEDANKQAPKSMVSKVSNDTSVTPLTMNWEGGMDVFVVEEDTNHDQDMDQKEA